LQRSAGGNGSTSGIFVPGLSRPMKNSDAMLEPPRTVTASRYRASADFT
jgi:hypothetical protein